MFCTRSDAVVWCRFRYSICKDLNGVVRLSGTGWSKFVGKFLIFMTCQPGAYTLTVKRHFEKLCVISAGTPTIWSSAPLGKFSGRGDFSLGVNMGSNSIPPQNLSDESTNSSHGLKRSWCSCPRWVNAGNKNTPSTHHPWRRNVTTLMVGLKKNGHIRKNLTQKWWTPEI